MITSEFYAVCIFASWVGGGLVVVSHTQCCFEQEHPRVGHMSHSLDVGCLLPVVSSQKHRCVWQLSVPQEPYGSYMSLFLPFFSKVFVFGTVTEWLHFYNKWLYCCLWIVNGLLQSTGWPCVVAVMGNWFGKAGYATSFLFNFSF